MELLVSQLLLAKDFAYNSVPQVNDGILKTLIRYLRHGIDIIYGITIVFAPKNGTQQILEE